ncbi:MAG: hypothetical protein M3347_05585, partial [Armatimonadota bacterium]|nr:hypothetical protein [Armatimonadota bacterium]
MMKENLPIVTMSVALLSAFATAAPMAPEPLVLGFEKGDAAVWKGGTVSETKAKTGQASLRWADVAQNPSLTWETAPTDWSPYNRLSFWLHSAVANGQGIQLVVPSENPATEGTDYFGRELKVDWTGWKKIELPFDQLWPTRTPQGWNQVGKFYLTVAGWGHTPLPDTELYLDEVRLEKVETLAPARTLVNPAFEDKDGDGVPDGWTIAPPANNTTLAVSLVKMADGNAVKIVDKDAKSGVGLSQWLKAQPAHQYSLSADVQGGEIPLYLKFYDAQRQLIDPEHRIMAQGGAEFTKHTITEIAPQRTEFVEVWFYTTSIGQTEVLVKKPEFADLGAAEVQKGPLTSDRQFFDAQNLDFPGLEAVKQAVA